MSAFKKFNEFINESLVIIDMKGMMKNEFMNNNQLRLDYENARRILYEKTSSLFEHKRETEFIARTQVNNTADQMDAALALVNEQTKRMKFSRSGKPNKTELGEWVWKINCSLD